jgi:hypothetical protein
VPVGGIGYAWQQLPNSQWLISTFIFFPVVQAHWKLVEGSKSFRDPAEHRISISIEATMNIIAGEVSACKVLS